MSITYAEQKAPDSITKHYTPEALAKRLIELVPIKATDTVLDPSAGRNNVFLKHVKAKRKLRCEIEEGMDFLAAPLLNYDWAITNPPYHLLRKFVDKTAEEANKGFAFLVNINGVNSFTPLCLDNLRTRGFYLRHLHVVNVKAWMGRYFFFVFSKQPGDCKHTWDTEAWKH
jgi:DNA modification methylase